MMADFIVRVGLGISRNSHFTFRRPINQEQAKQAAAAQTGGKALGAYQTSGKK